jgi:hypothetical protein
MRKVYNRREFVQNSLLATAGIGMLSSISPFSGFDVAPGKKLGLIGLDTSHVTAVTKALNYPGPNDNWNGYRVVAAYPTKGSPDMPASIDRLEGFTKSVKEMGVELVGSIDELLKKVDVVMLESVDGRRHLAEALPVIKSGKRLYIDKPLAASLADSIAIFNAAEKYNNPVWSTSSLRYMEGVKEVNEGKVGKVIGANTYGDGYIEPNHPDLFYYCIHGIELLFALMGTGCKSVVRVHQSDADLVVGTWEDGRIGSFRGGRTGKRSYGATVFGEIEIEIISKSRGYGPMWEEVIKFYDTGKIPIQPEETLNLFAFMEAGEESKKRKGQPVLIEDMMNKALKESKKLKI